MAFHRCSSNPPCEIWTNRKGFIDGGRRVLVVDDYEDVADAICVILAMIGYETRIECRGDTAAAAIASWRPGALLLDIAVPGLAEFAVAGRVRKTLLAGEMLLIGHSPMPSERDLEDAKAAGFDAFCSKPADPLHIGSILSHFGSVLH